MFSAAIFIRSFLRLLALPRPPVYCLSPLAYSLRLTPESGSGTWLQLATFLRSKLERRGGKDTELLLLLLLDPTVVVPVPLRVATVAPKDLVLFDTHTIARPACIGFYISRPLCPCDSR